ncbi:MAG: hypothetical protein F6J87_30630 [Spirulina sp. SIO3F2]|nr:hypothetical protein [Spirulina sp. SIO3F2]
MTPEELSNLREWVRDEPLNAARQKIKDGQSDDYYEGLNQAMEYVLDLFNIYDLNHGDFTVDIAALAIAAAEKSGLK